MSPGMFKHRYKQTRVYKDGIFTRNAVQAVLADISASKFFEHYQLTTPKLGFHFGEPQFSHASLFIAGTALLCAKHLI